MANSLAGRVAVVTGASRGIGRAATLALARQGCDVVVTAKSTQEQEGLEGTIFSVADEAEALGVRALPFQLDVRDSDRVADMVSTVVKELGAPGVVLCNARALQAVPLSLTSPQCRATRPTQGALEMHPSPSDTLVPYQRHHRLQ